MGFLMNYLYPTRCPACRDLLEGDGSRIHEACQEKFKLIREPRCLKCGRQVESEVIDVCFECSKKAQVFDYGYPCFEYNDTAKRAMLDFKQKGWKSNGEYFAEMMARNIGEQLMRHQPQALIPVPVHRQKQSERGFNQAKILADILGERLGIPVEESLKKIAKTAQQKSLGVNDRQKNSTSAFEYVGDVRYDRVCIVDDIFTTGSTINACAAVLKKAGINEVGFVTACAGRYIN